MKRSTVSTARAFVFVALVTACRPARLQTATLQGVDSLVLERTRCFGFCPAYRLSLRANGTVVFVSRNPGDSTRASDSIPRTVLAWIVQEAKNIDFYTLPPDIAKDRGLCPDRATDNPTATVTIFRTDTVANVIDYQGCFARNDHSTSSPITKLRHFEDQIDSVAQSARWVRPARLR